MSGLIAIAIIIGIIIILRLFGAWMLRINEIIEIQKDILFELKKISKNP
jgi:hypothetical protein